MILVDANLLVYAAVSSMPQHARARRWLDARLNGAPKVGLPWPSLVAFIRLVTNPRVFQHPLTMAKAWTQVASWLEVESVWIPQPTERHAELFALMLANAGANHALVPDAHLAALALEHGLTLCSADGDFARFPRLLFENPLRG